MRNSTVRAPAALRRAIARSIAIVLAAGAIAACSPRGEADPARAMAADLPDEAASIVGEVTSVLDGRIRVEEVPGEPSGSDKAVVGLAGARIVRRADGSAVGASALAVGQRVSVWFTGPVRESYPVQADAKLVVVESGAR